MLKWWLNGCWMDQTQPYLSQFCLGELIFVKSLRNWPWQFTIHSFATLCRLQFCQQSMAGPPKSALDSHHFILGYPLPHYSHPQRLMEPNVFGPWTGKLAWILVWVLGSSAILQCSPFEMMIVMEKLTYHIPHWEIWSSKLSSLLWDHTILVPWRRQSARSRQGLSKETPLELDRHLIGIQYIYSA